MVVVLVVVAAVVVVTGGAGGPTGSLGGELYEIQAVRTLNIPSLNFTGPVIFGALLDTSLSQEGDEGDRYDDEGGEEKEIAGGDMFVISGATGAV